jgi:hypothetical protein
MGVSMREILYSAEKLLLNATDDLAVHINKTETGIKATLMIKGGNLSIDETKKLLRQAKWKTKLSVEEGELYYTLNREIVNGTDAPNND